MVLVAHGTYCINVGEPWMPECPDGSDARQTMYITRALKERVRLLIEDVRMNKFWL